MLDISRLCCSYGDVTAVDNISFTLEKAEIFGLIGANGAGKTTTIMAIAGLIPIRSGNVFLNTSDITSLAAHQRIDQGLALVPEGRRVFSDLSVDENLTIGGTRLNPKTLKSSRNYAYEIFPWLAERRRQRAGSLSGGEQQMLALARAIMAQPQILLVDELSLGLMPKAIDECYRVLELLRQNGIAILLVEQNTERVLKIANKIAVLESGRMVWTGTGLEAQNTKQVFEAYLGGPAVSDTFIGSA